MVVLAVATITVTEHEDFNDMLAGYLKESESRLSTLKRQTDGKRGGRGGRRS